MKRPHQNAHVLAYSAEVFRKDREISKSLKEGKLDLDPYAVEQVLKALKSETWGSNK